MPFGYHISKESQYHHHHEPRGSQKGLGGGRETERERRAAGYRAALVNPNTTREGRRHAKEELHRMGKSAHVPWTKKLKRSLGIRNTPRRERQREREREYDEERSYGRRRKRY